MFAWQVLYPQSRLPDLVTGFLLFLFNSETVNFSLKKVDSLPPVPMTLWLASAYSEKLCTVASVLQKQLLTCLWEFGT